MMNETKGYGAELKEKGSLTGWRVSRRRISRLALICVVLALGLLLVGCGSEIPRPTKGYLYDGASLLSDDTEAHILSCSASLMSQCGVRIAVMTVGTTDGMTAAEYAEKVFRKWKLDDDAVLLLLAENDEDYWALQGKDTGLSKKTLGIMLSSYLEPYFAAKKYDEGVRSFFDALVAHFEAYHSVTVDENAEDIHDPENWEFEIDLPSGSGFFGSIGTLIAGIVKIIARLLSVVIRIAGGAFGMVFRMFSGIIGWILSLSTFGLIVVVLIIVAVVRSSGGRRR